MGLQNLEIQIQYLKILDSLRSTLQTYFRPHQFLERIVATASKYRSGAPPYDTHAEQFLNREITLTSVFVMSSYLVTFTVKTISHKTFNAITIERTNRINAGRIRMARI